MSDGTEQAVFYAEPIHVFDDETQRFELMDTVLAEKESVFVSGKNGFTAEFSKDKSNHGWSASHYRAVEKDWEA